MTINQSFLLPVFFLVFQTMLVGVVLAIKRVSFMRSRHIHPQKVAIRTQSAEVFAPISATSDNLQNLFEFPVLFYALSTILLATATVDSLFVYFAWAFVLTRFLHTVIHCTYNAVIHRFYVFVVGVGILFAMATRAALILLT